MKLKWFGLVGIILAVTLVAGPLAGVALAAGDHDDPHAGHDMSIMDQSDQMNGHDMNTMEDMSNDSLGHTGDDHGATESGHGGEPQDLNSPPNWPVIYGFGGFNLLVIIVAALLKTKGLGVS